MVVLKSLGIEVEAYFSSEIDEDSLLVSGSRHAEIIQVGCVLGISNQKVTISLFDYVFVCNSLIFLVKCESVSWMINTSGIHK